jgi:methionine synthase II (cobalamin-independent)
MQFARDIRDEAFEFNRVNMQVLELDEPMAGLEKALTKAIDAGDEARSLGLARGLRRYIIANGYADDDELPTEGE